MQILLLHGPCANAAALTILGNIGICRLLLVGLLVSGMGVVGVFDDEEGVRMLYICIHKIAHRIHLYVVK